MRVRIPSLYVGTSRVHNFKELRVLPLSKDDISFLTTLERDPLLKDWINNYDKDRKWKPDGFKKTEIELQNRIKMNLGLIDDFNELTKDEVIKYLKDLDIIFDQSEKIATCLDKLKKS